MPGNASLFQKSITKELDILKNRVRNLIGNAHWGEDGRFKEAVLKNVLRQFLPKHLSVGTGFILKANGQNDEDNLLSRQLDIIVYDNNLPVLFSEGDFIITTFENVRAIIEVKSRIQHGTLDDVISQFENSISSYIELINQISDDGTNILKRKIFTGIFAFEFDHNINSPRIDEALRMSNRVVNHFALGTNYFIRHWHQWENEKLAIPVECEHHFYNIYELNDLSFSYFISNLIDIACGGLEDRYWYAFPIEGTKEIHRLRTVCL